MTVITSQPWSFAALTDLHIGRGYPDYAGNGANDAGSIGLDYYLTQRLQNEVQHILYVKNQYNIKFVTVLGDISDSGEYSELAKAKQILDQLNTPDLFYVPLIGNHDLWPEIDSNKPNIVSTDNFYGVFKNQFNLLKSKLGADWNQSWDQMAIPSYVNYSFVVGGVRFLVLDFCSRDKNRKSTGFRSSDTQSWASNQLGLDGKSTILLSHIPMEKGRFFSNVGTILNFDEHDLENIKSEISKSGTKILANFAGHVHGFYDPTVISPHPIPLINIHFMDANKEYTSPDNPFRFPVVTTESLMVGSNIPDPKSPLRIINLINNEINNYNILNEGELAARAVNPYLSAKKPGFITNPMDWVKKLQGRKQVDFLAYVFSKRASDKYPLHYNLDLGDGQSKNWDYRRVEPKSIRHFYIGSSGTVFKATLTVQGYTRDGEKISENFTQQVGL
jgi:hypothetical protein